MLFSDIFADSKPGSRRGHPYFATGGVLVLVIVRSTKLFIPLYEQI
jgi:hypothetical protein